MATNSLFIKHWENIMRIQTTNCLLIGLAILTFSSPAKADVFTFETPSENIQCTVGLGRNISDINCTIIKRSGPPASPRPKNCRKDWGHTFSMNNTGVVKIYCSKTSNSTDGYDRANYGVTGKFGGITCHSSIKGFRCKNSNGHGFFLSRKEQSVF